jgi:CcmD family protein
MHKKAALTLFLLLSWLISLPVLAQDGAGSKKVEMADRFRADGKIYVVIAVLVIILLGIFAYVVRLDRKIGRLEKDSK